MLPPALAAVRRLLTVRAARWAAFAGVALLVVLGAYLRLSSPRAPDVSAVPFASFAGAAETPVCDGPREEPKVTDDAGGASLLRAARPPSNDELDAWAQPRERPSSSEHPSGAWDTTALARVPLLATARGTPRTGSDDDSPARRRARLMVFLN